MLDQRPHVILMGGFLGAGKTAAMLAMAHWLADQGIRSAFITNDQGSDLVDTRLLRSCGLTTEEIPGGCFCCRFDELAGLTRRRGVLPPEVIVAEAVGSCTDLVATVSAPMRRLLADECTVAPLSVLVDPVRATRMLGLDAGERFTANVEYIWHKQLEEADLIILTKCDLMSPADIVRIQEGIRRLNPRADQFAVSTRAGTGTDAWFRRLLFQEQSTRATIPLDYDRYADGEARLGWLNARVRVAHPQHGDGNALLLALGRDLRKRLGEKGVAVAHLKMTLEDGSSIAALNLVRGDAEPEVGLQLTNPTSAGVLTINLRAEADSRLLQEVLAASLQQPVPWLLEVEHLEAFQPGRPEPTHRDMVPAPITPPNT